MGNVAGSQCGNGARLAGFCGTGVLRAASEPIPHSSWGWGIYPVEHYPTMLLVLNMGEGKGGVLRNMERA